MKKSIVIIATIFAIVIGFSTLFATCSDVAVASESYEVQGWRTNVAFDDGDEQYLRLYTEFDRAPWIMDGKLYFWTLAEQKAIYKLRQYDDVDVSVDIGTINPAGKFNSGIYVHANDVWGDIDAVNGWAVMLERDADKTSYYLRLHRFADGEWKGCVEEVSGLKIPLNLVNLRVVVKSGMLYAFVDNQTTPVLSYEIGSEVGYVGLRNFYSPNYFDNLSIVGAGNEKDSTESDAIIDEAKGLDLDKLTSESKQQIQDALNSAENADNQYRLEQAVENLRKALKNAVEKRSAEELNAVIEQAQQITDGSIYTQNSWNSFCAVLEIGKTIDLTDEEAVSYWTNRLELKIELLVEYGG